MLEKLLNSEAWDQFIKTKLDNDYTSVFVARSFNKIIKRETYKEISKALVGGTYEFSIPKKHIISKHSSAKRRVVYCFNQDEMFVLKHISYLLYEYDHLFSPNLYSFRKNTGVKRAIKCLTNRRNRNRMYGYKLDISNYFNSINTNLFLDEVKDYVSQDIYDLYQKIYSIPGVLYKNEIINENKGAMAGMPLSAFVANFFIRDIDRYFYDNKVFYLRYADDIIFFTKTEEERSKYREILINKLQERGLSINHDKEVMIEPGDPFEFLGFSFKGKSIDISANSKKKIKAKIKRQARRIRKWCLTKGLPLEKGLVAINKRFNKKFYAKESNETSWTYWYFPNINTIESLKEIDLYFQQELRYLYTGKHNKANYKKCPYQLLKENGYRPLVHGYFKFKKN